MFKFELYHMYVRMYVTYITLRQMHLHVFKIILGIKPTSLIVKWNLLTYIRQ